MSEIDRQYVMESLQDIMRHGYEKQREAQRLTEFAQEGMMFFLRGRLDKEVCNKAIANFNHHKELSPLNCWQLALLH